MIYKKIFNASLILFLAFSFLGFGIPYASAATASLYLTPASGNYAVGATFSVSVKVSSPEQAMNTAQGSISYDAAKLEATGVSKGGSIFSLWFSEPSPSAGTINFGGGVPQPGYTGSAGTIFTITFKAKQAGDAVVRVASGAILANDGKGTSIPLGMGSAKYTIGAAGQKPKPTTDKPAPPASPPEPSALFNNPEVSSPTHPDQEKWYRTNTVKFSWETPSGVTGVSAIFDDKAVSDPGPVSDGVFAEKEYKDVEDGVWYFHVKLKDTTRWGSPTHYRVNIDTKAPNAFEPEVESAGPGEWPAIKFETTDDGSGLDHYEVVIGSLEEQAHIVSVDIASLITSDLEVGEHTALVKAIDKAGNETIATIKFTIDAIAAPIITSYPSEMRASDQLYIGGTSIPNATVSVYIDVNGAILENSVKSDAEGNWFFVARDTLPNGRYSAWAVAMNKNGIKSLPSQKISFLVSPPIFTVVGNFVISYFTVLVSMLFLIVLIIAIIFFIIALVRKKLKKETVEIEDVLKRNLDSLRVEIEEDLLSLKKASTSAEMTKEKARIKTAINKKIDTAGNNILKEIKDVEDILK